MTGPRVWTIARRRRLREAWSTTTSAVLAAEFGLSKYAVDHQIKREGLATKQNSHRCCVGCDADLPRNSGGLWCSEPCYQDWAARVASAPPRVGPLKPKPEIVVVAPLPTSRFKPESVAKRLEWEARRAQKADFLGADVHEIDEVQAEIRAIRLARAARMKRRDCLTCGVEFLSDGPGNRLCGKCRVKTESIYESA
jgi:hypothetical protein